MAFAFTRRSHLTMPGLRQWNKQSEQTLRDTMMAADFNTIVLNLQRHRNYARWSTKRWMGGKERALFQQNLHSTIIARNINAWRGSVQNPAPQHSWMQVKRPFMCYPFLSQPSATNNYNDNWTENEWIPTKIHPHTVGAVWKRGVLGLL